VPESEGVLQPELGKVTWMPAHWQYSLAVLLLASAAVPTAAVARDGDVDAFMSDCGGVDLAPSAIDSCLERARVLDETAPSPEVQSVEASLEQRKSGKPGQGSGARVVTRPARSESDDVQMYRSGTYEGPPSAEGTPRPLGPQENRTMPASAGDVPSQAWVPADEGPPGEERSPRPEMAAPSGDVQTQPWGPSDYNGNHPVSEDRPREAPDVRGDEPPAGVDAEDQPPIEDPPDQRPPPSADDPQ